MAVGDHGNNQIAKSKVSGFQANQTSPYQTYGSQFLNNNHGCTSCPIQCAQILGHNVPNFGRGR